MKNNKSEKEASNQQKNERIKTSILSILDKSIDDEIKKKEIELKNEENGNSLVINNQTDGVNIGFSDSFDYDRKQYTAIFTIDHPYFNKKRAIPPLLNESFSSETLKIKPSTSLPSGFIDEQKKMFS